MLQRHAALLVAHRAAFGVPPQILVAIWGLETDFGPGDMGKLPVIRTLATMAHDCRRTELFQRELLAALQIVQRGDLPLRDLIGAYAGEIGQTQFLPSSYIKYGVDFDGNGHVDLRHSVPDVLASTANLLKTNGWKAGGDYHEGSANFDAMREWNHSDDLPQDHRPVRRSARWAVRLDFATSPVLVTARPRGRGDPVFAKGNASSITFHSFSTGFPLSRE